MKASLLRWTRDGALTLPWAAHESFDSLVQTPALQERLRGIATRFREGKGAFARRSLTWRCGLFLFGPAGTGKSAAARAIARLLEWDCVSIPAHEILDSHLFESAMAFAATKEGPCVIVLEDIDELIRRMEPHVFFTILDQAMYRTEGALWIATTRHAEHAPKTQLLRPGRFEDAIRFDHPSTDLRRLLLEHCLPEATATLPSQGPVTDTAWMSNSETLSDAAGSASDSVAFSSVSPIAETFLDEMVAATAGLSFSQFEEIRLVTIRAELDEKSGTLESEIRTYVQDQIIAGDRSGGVSDLTEEVEERVRQLDPRVLKAALDMTDVFRTLMEKTIGDAAEKAREGSASSSRDQK